MRDLEDSIDIDEAEDYEGCNAEDQADHVGVVGFVTPEGDDGKSQGIHHRQAIPREEDGVADDSRQAGSDAFL